MRDILCGDRSLLTIELTFNNSWYWSDFSRKLRFDAIKIVSVIVSYEINGKPEMSKAPCTTDTMKISFRCFREIEVDDNIHRLNVDAASK